MGRRSQRASIPPAMAVTRTISRSRPISRLSKARSSAGWSICAILTRIQVKTYGYEGILLKVEPILGIEVTEDYYDLSALSAFLATIWQSNPKILTTVKIMKPVLTLVRNCG
ncbi:hypothetical protein ES703_95199 [subsurface metagenome]